MNATSVRNQVFSLEQNLLCKQSIWAITLLSIGLAGNIFWFTPVSQAQDGKSRATYAGVTLASIAEDLQSNSQVIRRRAALSLLPFCSENEQLSDESQLEEILLQGLQHTDPAVVFWTCENATLISVPADSIKAKLSELALDSKSRHVQLAASFADFHFHQTNTSLDFLLQTIERPRTGEKFKDTKEMASAVTAADYIARLGRKKLGQRLPEVIKRLRDVSSQVQADLDSGKFHWQIYHPQKACQRTLALLENPDYETRQPFQASKPDAIPNGITQRELAVTVTKSATPDQIWSNPKRPNILWISCEDISPNLGCYGDKYANTPHLDKLAKQGVLFRNAFTHAGVCAVLRSGVITGRYPISIGTQHMRSFRPTLTDTPCFPELMRKTGYFCTNNSKTDYQFEHSTQTWDREGNKHNDWQDRAEDQPFFSVINLTISHESQVRHSEEKHNQILTHLMSDQRHDPRVAAEFLPPYFPNTKETRQDWAWYQDNISEMDRQVGDILKRLDDDGLSDSTIVVFWSDHGQGLPRGKRWLYDSGTHVPMIVRYPGQFASDTERKDLVTLLDLAPTMLSTAGVAVPENMDGRILWGKNRQPEPNALFFHRDRMDETLDLIRSVRNHQFRYMRNYQPQRTYAQFLEYMELMPTMQAWRSGHQSQSLTPVSERWFSFKPVEELYDVQADPHQINNLALRPEYGQILGSMRNELNQWQEKENDLGMTPEVIMLDELWPEN